eukprot:2732848-Rhodomonas_salina.1
MAAKVMDLMDSPSATGRRGRKKASLEAQWKKEGVSREGEGGLKFYEFEVPMPPNSPSTPSRQQLLPGGGAGVLFDSSFDLFSCLS